MTWLLRCNLGYGTFIWMEFLNLFCFEECPHGVWTNMFVHTYNALLAYLGHTIKGTSQYNEIAFAHCKLWKLKDEN